jgi:hypothetical protein
MPVLPALISRPLLDAAPAASDNGFAPGQTVQQELAAGLPARVDLDGDRSLVLAVPLGVATGVLAADPMTVVFDTGVPNPSDLTALRDSDGAWPRLTLVLTGAIGQTVPVVLGVPVRRVAGAAAGVAAVVEVTVDRLVVTVGSLRSPGRFGSQLTLRWRDLTLAPDTGTPAPVGDLSIPRLATGG